jgi:hypothetical protein
MSLWRLLVLKIRLESLPTSVLRFKTGAGIKLLPALLPAIMENDA